MEPLRNMDDDPRGRRGDSHIKAMEMIVIPFRVRGMVVPFRVLIEPKGAYVCMYVWYLLEVKNCPDQLPTKLWYL